MYKKNDEKIMRAGHVIPGQTPAKYLLWVLVRTIQYTYTYDCSWNVL